MLSRPYRRCADLTWTGAAGTNDWQTAANWSPQQPPTLNDTITISGAHVVYATQDSDFGLQSAGTTLILENGARLDFGTLTPNGTYTGDDTNAKILRFDPILTLGASSTLNADRLFVHGTNTIDGTVNIYNIFAPGSDNVVLNFGEKGIVRYMSGAVNGIDGNSRNATVNVALTTGIANATSVYHVQNRYLIQGPQADGFVSKYGNFTVNAGTVTGSTGETLSNAGNTTITLQNNTTYPEFTPLTATASDFGKFVLAFTGQGLLIQYVVATPNLTDSTLTAPLNAQHNALRSHMTHIRNRTLHLSLDPAIEHEDVPMYHFWLQATGGYANAHTQADAAGYKLNNIGGVAGLDANLDTNLAMGIAFGADHGDLKSNARGIFNTTADGDLSAYYLHLYTRYQSKRFAHLFLLSGMLYNADLNRRLDLGAIIATTHGSSNGSGFSAMYELTYDVVLNDDKTSLLQPLFNAQIVRTNLDAYTEQCDTLNSQLAVDKQERTTATLALGVRWLAQTGTNLFGRSVITALRANIAQDFGDAYGKVNTQMVGTPGTDATAYSVKTGRTALQLGAGIQIPVSLQSNIFLNVNADFRQRANAVNGSIGYRYDF